VYNWFFGGQSKRWDLVIDVAAVSIMAETILRMISNRFLTYL